MIRTIIWFIWFFLSLIISTPFLLRVKYLSKKGRVEESNNLTNKCAHIWANSLNCRSKGKCTWLRKPS